MRAGQLFGAGVDRVQLLCEVTSIDDSGIHAWVVNGAWNITFQPNRTICHGSDGDNTITARVLYTGELPAHLRYEYRCEDVYNEALEWMNDRYNSHTPIWIVNSVSTLKVRTARLHNACHAAVRAFKEAWQPQKHKGMDFDDTDIPF